MSTKSNTNGFATIREAADFLRLGRSTVYAMVRSGRLTSTRFGRAVRVPRAALVALAEVAMNPQ